MDKFEFKEDNTVYVATKHNNQWVVTWGERNRATYDINNHPLNWINKMISKHVPAPNGVDAEGKAIFFDDNMLKPFMRVERQEGTFGIFVGNVNGSGPSTVGGFKNGCEWTSHFRLDQDGDYSETVAVYAAPEYTSKYLDVNARGKLIWKRQVPKSSEQLAQEAAVATRNKAIEEAEKALKVAQEKLAELKGL